MRWLEQEHKYTCGEETLTASIHSADSALALAPVPTADTPAPVLVLVHAGVAGIVVLLHRT